MIIKNLKILYTKNIKSIFNNEFLGCFLMIYTIDEIKDIAIPIVQEYGVNRLSLFGSYAKGEANDSSDLDFFIEKGELKGLIQYNSLVRNLEEKFNRHVDLITSGVSDKEFLKSEDFLLIAK